MGIRKVILSVFTLVLITIMFVSIYLLFYSNDLDAPERDLSECYDAARSRADGADRGVCYEHCTDMQGEPLEENVLNDCLAGNYEAILKRIG
ncbi:MAG: hypothetical protein ACOCTT_00175 [archaeon]